MPNSGIGGQLPEHMRVGRAQMPGPVTGGYVSFSFGPITDTSVANDTESVSFQLPFDFRVEHMSWRAAAATTMNMELSSNADDLIDGSETALLSAAVDVDANLTGTIEASGTTPTLVEAARNVAKDQFLIVHISGGGTGSVTDLVVTITGFPYGHVNTDPDND